MLYKSNNKKVESILNGVIKLASIYHDDLEYDDYDKKCIYIPYGYDKLLKLTSYVTDYNELTVVLETGTDYLMYDITFNAIDGTILDTLVSSLFETSEIFFANLLNVLSA